MVTIANLPLDEPQLFTQEICNQIEEDQIKQALNELSDIWKHENDDFINFSYGKLGFYDSVPSTHDEITEHGKACFAPILTIQHIINVKGLNSIDNPEITSHIGRIANLAALSIDTIHNVFSSKMIQMANRQDSESETGAQCTDDFFSRFKFSWGFATDEQSAYQGLILFMLQRALKHSYRRVGDLCFKEIFVSGVATHAWEEAESISSFVYRSVSKDTMFTQWQAATSSGNVIENVIKHLKHCIDDEFPDLEPDRYLHSFRNGIYNVNKDEFNLHGTLSRRCVAMQYTDIEIPQAVIDSDWNSIPTPDFDSIFKYQQYDDETLEWTYALLGRVLYQVNELDFWQVAPFFIGVAGCGKSTVCALVKSFFHPIKVSTISSNSEGRFGLAGVVDSDICICTEVTKRFPLDRGVWQAAVTGERLCVPIKNQAPKDLDWKIPFLMAGNETPDWTDTSRSVFRRMIPMYMNKSVKQNASDPLLIKRLLNQSGTHLVKFNRAYRAKVEEFREKDIWSKNVLSKQMLDFHVKMLGDIDILARFIDENCIVQQNDDFGQVFCTDDAFHAQFKSFYSKITGDSKLIRWNETTYKCTFDDNGIQIEPSGSRTYPRCAIDDAKNYTNVRFLLGVDLKTNIVGEDGFEDII